MKETRQSAFAGALRLPRVPVWRLGLLWEDYPTFRTCKEMFLGDSALRGFSPEGKLIVTSEHLWSTSQIYFALGVSRRFPTWKRAAAALEPVSACAKPRMSTSELGSDLTPPL